MIADGTIQDADVSNSAAIGLSKLATGSLPTGITVSSSNIVDGTIVDADINASAAIALTKLGTGACRQVSRLLRLALLVEYLQVILQLVLYQTM